MDEDLFNPDGTLVHFGVKGMKWGVIRKKPRSYETNKAKGYTKRQLESDLQTFGERGAARINDRMNKGRGRARSVGTEFVRTGVVRGGTSLAVGAAWWGYKLRGPIKAAAISSLNNAVAKKQMANGAKMAAEAASRNRGLWAGPVVNLTRDAASGIWK